MLLTNQDLLEDLYEFAEELYDVSISDTTYLGRRELIVSAPMGNVWDNGDHGLAVDPEDGDSIREANALVFSGYSECTENECEVCSY